MSQSVNITHCAGVLSDGAITVQTPKKFSTVLLPKLFAGWYLHRIISKSEYSGSFVLFSSIAALLGLAGQSNHAAANTGLDSLAAYRVSVCQQGTSINWGAVGQIGYAARHSSGAILGIFTLVPYSLAW
jgi:ABC-type Co2+ transport system permease subunit